MNPRVKSVTTTTDYKLQLVFDNGEQGVYDCSDLLDFGIFRELKNIDYFQKAYLNFGTVAWPHEQDICPDTLYLGSSKGE